MNKILALILVAGSLVSAAPKKPKLVVAIVIDQFRYDYLTRYRADYHGGFDLLLTKGAVFTNARYQHFPTVTAVGHSIFMSGAMPSVSGIIGNAWYDRDEGKQVTSVSDPETTLVGAPGEGASPPALTISRKRRRGSRRSMLRTRPTSTPAKPGWATKCRNRDGCIESWKRRRTATSW